MSTMGEIITEISERGITLFEYLEETDVPQLQQSLNVIRADLQRLSINQQLNTSQINELYSLFSTIQPQLDRIPVLTEAVEALNSEFISLSTLVQGYDFRITNNAIDLEIQTNRINQHQFEIGQLSGRMQTLTELVSFNTGRTNLLESSVDLLLRSSIVRGHATGNVTYNMVALSPPANTNTVLSFCRFQISGPVFVETLVNVGERNTLTGPFLSSNVVIRSTGNFTHQPDTFAVQIGVPYVISGSRFVNSGSNVYFYPTNTEN